MHLSTCNLVQLLTSIVANLLLPQYNFSNSVQSLKSNAVMMLLPQLSNVRFAAQLLKSNVVSWFPPHRKVFNCEQPLIFSVVRLVLAAIVRWQLSVCRLAQLLTLRVEILLSSQVRFSNPVQLFKFNVVMLLWPQSSVFRLGYLLRSNVFRPIFGQ